MLHLAIKCQISGITTLINFTLFNWTFLSPGPASLKPISPIFPDFLLIQINKNLHWIRCYFISVSALCHDRTWPFKGSVEAIGSPGGTVVKNLPASTGHAGDLCWEDPLEEEMETYSSILAWRISWTVEPGGLQSMGWQLDMTEYESVCVCEIERERERETDRQRDHGGNKSGEVCSWGAAFLLQGNCLCDVIKNTFFLFFASNKLYF